MNNNWAAWPHRSFGCFWRRWLTVSVILGQESAVAQRPSEAGWAIHFPEGPHEKLGLLWRAASINWTQSCWVLIWSLYKLVLVRVDVTIRQRKCETELEKKPFTAFCYYADCLSCFVSAIIQFNKVFWNELSHWVTGEFWRAFSVSVTLLLLFYLAALFYAALPSCVRIQREESKSTT